MIDRFKRPINGAVMPKSLQILYPREPYDNLPLFIDWHNSSILGFRHLFSALCSFFSCADFFRSSDFRPNGEKSKKSGMTSASAVTGQHATDPDQAKRD